MGSNSPVKGKQKIKNIIIAGVVGVLGFSILISIIIIVKKRRKPYALPVYDRPYKTGDENAVVFENKAYTWILTYKIYPIFVNTNMKTEKTKVKIETNWKNKNKF